MESVTTLHFRRKQCQLNAQWIPRNLVPPLSVLSETLVSCHDITRHHSPRDHDTNLHRRENFKSRIRIK